MPRRKRRPSRADQPRHPGQASKGESPRQESDQSLGLGARPLALVNSREQRGRMEALGVKGKIVNVTKRVRCVVALPPPPNSTATAAPAGIVFNGTATDFTGDVFIFATEDGTIAGWQPAD